jgi:hypothetical protein
MIALRKLGLPSGDEGKPLKGGIEAKNPKSFDKAHRRKAFVMTQCSTAPQSAIELKAISTARALGSI